MQPRLPGGLVVAGALEDTRHHLRRAEAAFAQYAVDARLRLPVQPVELLRAT